MSELLHLLEDIENAFGVRVCVHDISGLTLVNSSLELPIEWKTHGNQYCSVAKDYRTEQFCMVQKEQSLKQLKDNGLKPYCRVCPMGVCDYMMPVLQEGKLLAVIYVSGVAHERKTDARKSLMQQMELISFDCPELLLAYDEYARLTAVSVDQMRVIAELVRAYLLKATGYNAFYREVPDNMLDMHSVEPVKTKTFGTASVIIKYIGENYTRPMSANAIAMRFFISPGHLNRLVQRETGMSVSAYIKHLRISTARHLLENTDMDIHKLGESCGYPDMNYFCRVFKAENGLSPTEYRKRYAKFSKQAHLKP